VARRRILGQELRDGHEAVAAAAQPPDHDRERLGRLAARAAAVVHEHDRPGAGP
jgi:hypothetical protein